SQIGYMLMGLGIALHAMGGWDGGPLPETAVLALTGAIFYMIHHIVVKTNLFLIAGAILAGLGPVLAGSTGKPVGALLAVMGAGVALAGAPAVYRAKLAVSPAPYTP
ncbi:MAG: hypothetical protein AAFZ07_30385, partial [Actinomycetota bacterium]